MPFAIGDSVIYTEPFKSYEDKRTVEERSWSAVIEEVWFYKKQYGGESGSYYIRFDGDVVPPSGFDGCLRLNADLLLLKPYARSAEWEKNAAAFQALVDAVVAANKTRGTMLYEDPC